MTQPKFNIGDTVWLATCGNTQKITTCEVCYGKKQVKLILGNDEECILDCGYCSKGYDNPTGYTQAYEWAAEPKQAIVTGISIDSSKQYNYSFSQYHGDNENVFLTKEEALARCAEMIKEHEKTQQNQLEYCKFNDKKNYAWNAGYHRGEAKRAKQQLEYHTKKAVFMAAKVVSSDSTRL